MQRILVEEYRGSVLECTHAGHICGVDDTGSIRYASGNPLHMTYLRSAAKPFQAIPVLQHGIEKRFGFTGKETAVIAGSHRGEPFHIEAVESMLHKIGIGEEKLVCASTYPLNVSARDEVVRKSSPKRRVFHNCSGKHSGILALCKGLGYEMESYCDPEHPAQRQILRTLASLSEVPEEQIPIGIDGCGFPVFALPLDGLARAYLKLACPNLIVDVQIRSAVEKLTALMSEHNEMIAGTDFICSVLLRDSNIVAKGGAKGVYCFGLKNERLAFALKVLDGSEEEWPLIVASILEQINYPNHATIDDLYRISQATIRNDANRIVGFSKAVFDLTE
ncbi:asparaginase [Paenibacillus aceris]|uniref:L-asparaginase II n=1 Tax=Paenibacillus aceris TaxID=869555 RepID=A0ABS4I0Y9_9BACL|nr:asparaginase [Paenibacillus aceris]MBP1964577.1 L-asparaginase II [Paenibacillus aceris]NHW35715.1 asparaginase [Paenibacillus aceris]